MTALTFFSPIKNKLFLVPLIIEKLISRAIQKMNRKKEETGSPISLSTAETPAAE